MRNARLSGSILDRVRRRFARAQQVLEPFGHPAIVVSPLLNQRRFLIQWGRGRQILCRTSDRLASPADAPVFERK